MITRLGERIRELREEKDMSLRELARKTGVTAPFLSDVELGKRFPGAENLALIAKALDVTVEYLEQYDSRPPIEEMKKLAAQNPALGIAFRRIADLPQDEILKIAKGLEAKKKK